MFHVHVHTHVKTTTPYQVFINNVLIYTHLHPHSIKIAHLIHHRVSQASSGIALKGSGKPSYHPFCHVRQFRPASNNLTYINMCTVASHRTSMHLDASLDTTSTTKLKLQPTRLTLPLTAGEYKQRVEPISLPGGVSATAKLKRPHQNGELLNHVGPQGLL